MSHKVVFSPSARALSRHRLKIIFHPYMWVLEETEIDLYSVPQKEHAGGVDPQWLHSHHMNTAPEWDPRFSLVLPFEHWGKLVPEVFFSLPIRTLQAVETEHGRTLQTVDGDISPSIPALWRFWIKNSHQFFIRVLQKTEPQQFLQSFQNSITGNRDPTVSSVPPQSAVGCLDTMVHVVYPSVQEADLIVFIPSTRCCQSLWLNSIFNLYIKSWSGREPDMSSAPHHSTAGLDLNIFSHSIRAWHEPETQGWFLSLCQSAANIRDTQPLQSLH